MILGGMRLLTDIILPVFQTFGIFAVASVRFIIAVRYATPISPRYLSMMGEISSFI